MDSSGSGCASLLSTFRIGLTSAPSIPSPQLPPACTNHHPLTLLPNPPYGFGSFTCHACLYYSHAFVHHCAACQFDLHVGCASLSETVKRDHHQHPLVLSFHSLLAAYVGEDKIFICHVCHVQVPESCWVYYYQGCDYGTH